MRVLNEKTKKVLFQNIKERLQYDPEVLLLKEMDLVREFNEIRGGWHFKLKNLKFTELTLSKSTAGISMEQKLNFLAFIPLVSGNEMTNERKDLFRYLKQYECSLKYEGFLGNKLSFDIRPELWLFSKVNKDFKPNKKMAIILNSDSEIMSFVHKNKPSSFVLTLYSLPLGADIKESERFSLEYSFFQNPEFITWLIYLSMIIPKWRYKETFINTISVINKSSNYILEVCKELGNKC